MKKVKTILLMLLLITSSLLLLTGCKKKLKMNEEKCEEVVLEYLENKYQTEFEILEGGEKYGFAGPRGYARFTVNDTADNKEDRYAVTVYPDGSSDKDKDGYYDSYKVVSDEYMGEKIWKYVRKDLDELLKETELTRFFISNISIDEYIGMVGTTGLSAEFPILSEESFSLRDIMDNHIMEIHCWIDIPESEKSDTLQSSITNIIKPLISEDLIMFTIDVYEDEVYNKIEELNKNNISYDEQSKESIRFSVKEEDKKDEFK